jgi:hypothetical protein
MFILSLNWLGCQCQITRWLPGLPSDGLQPGKISGTTSRLALQGGLRQPISAGSCRGLFQPHETSRHTRPRSSKPTLHMVWRL